MSTTWRMSRQTVRANDDTRAAGARAFFFNEGTTTPRTVYGDRYQSVPLAQPVVADGFGRFPKVFLQDGTFRERVTTSDGVLLWDDDGLDTGGTTVAPPGGGSVDPTTVYQTGDLKPRFAIGTHTGWVRAGGGTIGNASSAASERANDDCHALYVLLWTSVPNDILVVTGGRGASAEADWSAGKPIELPDLRGRDLRGLDAMGGAAANRVHPTITGFERGDATRLGAVGGTSAVTLGINQIPAHDHGGSTGSAGAHAHVTAVPNNPIPGYGPGGSSAVAGTTAGSTNGVADHVHSIPAVGGNEGHSNMAPFVFVSVYVKL